VTTGVASLTPLLSEPLRRLHAEGRGVVLVTGHLGNPEIGGLARSTRRAADSLGANQQTNVRLNRFSKGSDQLRPANSL
jgi:lauroyl/myristoyl acyltransferase